MNRTIHRYIPKDSRPVEFPDVQAIAYITDNGSPCAMGYHGKAGHPDFNYRFRSPDHRNQYIQEWAEGLRAHKIMMEERKANRKAANMEAVNRVKVGDIFHWSWGYDQTNCDYYQVTEKHGQQVTLRNIHGHSVPGSEGFMCCNMIPDKDNFIEGNRAETLVKLVQAFKPGDNPYVSMEFGWCDLWDGKPDYCSWYA